MSNKNFFDITGETPNAWSLMRAGDVCGRVLVKYTKSGTAYCLFQFWVKGKWVSSVGKAGGYGYDKASAALADAIQKTGVISTGAHDEKAAWTFQNSNELGKRKEFAEFLDLQRSKEIPEIIPVYGGTGMNSAKKAFEAVGFTVIDTI